MAGFLFPDGPVGSYLTVRDGSSGVSDLTLSQLLSVGGRGEGGGGGKEEKLRLVASISLISSLLMCPSHTHTQTFFNIMWSATL